MTAAEEIIRPAQLIELYKIGFKLVPLDEDGKPAIAWTDIYENVNYWNPDKLVRESYRFNNVATTFGMTHLKDDQGPLYLYGLDIDSEEVYNILFRLSKGDSEEFSLIPKMQECSFVTKTKKTLGFHIYWLSHKEYKQILTTECKPKFEFEIKADKSLSTLPPSRHRDDSSFHYKNQGKEKIWISDGFYDRLVNVLGDCFLKTKRSESAPTYDHKNDGHVELNDTEIQIIAAAICPYYKKPYRHALVLALSGLLHKSNLSKESTLNLIQILAKDDEEISFRVSTVEETFQKDSKIVCGSKYFSGVLEGANTDHSTVKELLAKIYRVISKGDAIHRLTRNIMMEHAFKTMKDNEEIYYYDNEQGIYVLGAEWLIKELSELMYQEISTHELQEVINHIKRRTYIDRSQFDSNVDVLNLQNGLLNIHTLEFRAHSPDELSLVQLPLRYCPACKCPNILRFLGQVLKPKDVFTALELFGYCLYRSAKYEKAVLCIGKGANGKGTFLKIVERFLGSKNTSHVSLQDMNNERFANAGLFGKLANTFADLKADKLKETGPIKMLVSGDFIRAQKKYGQPFEFPNYAKLIFSANTIPQSDDETYAYFRRWIIFFFEKVFEGGEKDTNLIDKLVTEEEFSGLVNLALIALRQLIKDNEFIHSDDIETVEREYNLNASTVDRFVSESCEITGNTEDHIISRDLWGIYLAYCKENKITSKSDNIFGMELRQLHVKKDRQRIKGELDYCYVGIRLKETGSL